MEQHQGRTGKEVRQSLDLLLERGEPEVYRRGELRAIGMPVGGLFAGTVYLGGDGQLWNWDIFNQERLGCVEREPTVFMGDTLNAMGGANYVDPVSQRSPFRQRFDLLVEGRAVRFGDVAFRGEYPIGRVTYRQADAPVEMELEAFSPFIPLDAESSSFPATTLTFTVRNVGPDPINAMLRYESDNPVLAYSRRARSDFELVGQPDGGSVRFAARALPPKADSRPDVLFEDWSSGTYGGWKPTGTAFGEGPQRADALPAYMGPIDAGTTFVVNTHQTRHGEDVVQADQHVGRLVSPEFVITRRFVALRVGGGSHAGTCIHLLVDGQVVRTASGRNSNAMRWESWDVEAWEGRTARLEVVDEVTGGWGQISLGEVLFTDQPRTWSELHLEPDFGEFAFRFLQGGEASASPASGSVHHTVSLQPGEERSCTLLIAWHFPNCARNLPGKRHWYATRWPNTGAVLDELTKRWAELSARTRDWNATWYDSTLPYWFLDRTFINTSTLATTTCLRLDEGRYWFWEGVGCCPGTCTHVWGYAQAIGRVFPEVERYLRQEIDFGRAYRPETGAIDYRAEFHQTVAVDGQASCILRAYREHLMSTDMTFLEAVWPQVKGATEYLIRQDESEDGLLDGAQYNTLDTAWFGHISWISSLYLAALRAASAMAREMGDASFADRCDRIADRGADRMVKDLYNGEYFIHKVDPAHPEANNTNDGCHIDQVYGQAWAHQVGLPRVLPAEPTRRALGALFGHNFYEDVWEYRRRNRAIPGGRWYASPGEAGLIMTTFPRGGTQQSIGQSGDAWAVGYFNECMSGFEHQAAAHMIAEGLIREGLAVIHAIHERYHAARRNPYNEVECSDHYGRAMASYGALVAISGMTSHGPSAKLAFDPKVGGEFRCPFIDAHGWGTYSRDASGRESMSYRWRTAPVLG